MNDTSDGIVDETVIPFPPRVSTDHVVHTVENPVDNDVAELFPVRRLIVVGSAGWPLREVVPRVMLDWWISNERPKVTIVVANDDVGQIALATINPNVAIHEVIAYEQVRNPLRTLIRRIMAPGVEHAFVFRLNDDPVAAQWIEQLREHNIPATIVGLDIVEARS